MNRKGLSPSPNYTPLMMDGDYHAKIKQKILNVGNTYPRMAPPKRVEDPAPTLTHLSEKEKKKNAEFEKKMSELCHEWAEKGGEPFDILIAKDAKILFHDAFGENLEGKFSTDIPNEIASITKLISGLLFAQYVDQGLLGIDDYIGEYLPDFTVTGDSSLTFRACFTHVNGMWGHSSWGGVRRPWYDNSAALYMPFTSVGTFHFYNGDGYNLVGKVMEIISGKSIFRIMNEQLFQPLDLKNTFQDTDLAFGTKSTAHDIAVIAQMLLNRGKYGDLYFFSEETYKALLPVDLNNYFPGIKDIIWGIGIVPMNNYQENEATGEKRAIISESGLGHGSATSSILRVYPDKNIVIGSSRMNHGKDYEKYNEKMLLLIEKYFVK
jgi:CubicO group peptidase (beta-lactamase class C family)